MNSHGFVLGAGALALLAGVALPQAAGAADFYKNKRMTHYITSGSGGSVDLMNRLGARHVGRHIPGNPTVLAKNKTGAGGIVGANYLYNQAPKDGTETMGSLMSVPVLPLFYGNTGRGKNIKYDPTKFNWIGAPARFVAVAMSWHTSPVKTWKDLLKHELVVGSSGVGSSSTVDAVFLKNLLGFKYRVIIGYPSGGDIDLAMVRGETQGRATNAWAGLTSRHPDWLTDKKVNLLYQQGLEPDPAVPSSVPLLIDQISDPEKKAILKLKMAQFELGYPVYMPPGVPKDRVEIMRKAYAATYRDPKYLAEAKKARVLVAPISAEKVTKIIEETFSAPQELQAKLRAYLKPGKLERAKVIKVSSAITGLQKKGRVIVFADNGKPAHAKIGKKTKISVGGKKAKRGALKTGLNCQIEYYGEMSQAKSIKCK
ncbi:MAG: tripartite tricarboxylate transporter substrate-binding protein [Alphaproteobacteria bacterium]|nr:tripartite tricarboxylate transporter substrate-binding protein [Alphaproteobacteria bacterium]